MDAEADGGGGQQMLVEPIYVNDPRPIIVKIPEPECAVIFESDDFIITTG